MKTNYYVRTDTVVIDLIYDNLELKENIIP